jgi:predicted phage terminase large subunit-like protein
MARPTQVLSRTEAAACEELPDLYGFIPRLGRNFAAPRHLDPLVQKLEASWTRPVRCSAHAPPRHAKTDTVLAFIALTLRRQPWRTLGYVSYSAQISLSKSAKARRWALAAGVKLAPGAQRLSEWRTTEGGGLLATGIGGALTSHGLDGLFVDDPYKNRQQAESTAYQAMVRDWSDDVAETRLEPGASFFIFHTRWVVNDLIAHVHDTEGSLFEPHIKLPAVNERGEALWPERWPLEALKPKMLNAYAWASLYQGDPRPRGGKVFENVFYYDELPKEGYQLAIGIDLAYTKKKHSDWSVAIVMMRRGRTYYVVHVERRQARAPEFRGVLVVLHRRYPHAPLKMYAGGTERGSIDLMAAPPRRDDGEDDEDRDEGVEIDADPATQDKFLRAQPLAAAWNDGRVLVPRNAPWLKDFLEELSKFTGIDDDTDDQVDGGAAAFDDMDEEPLRFENHASPQSHW